MSKILFRVSTFAAASAIAGGLVAAPQAAPLTSARASHGGQAYAAQDDLADDAAAAGETGVAGHARPYRLWRAAPAPSPAEAFPDARTAAATPYAEDYAQNQDWTYGEEAASDQPAGPFPARHPARRAPHHRPAHHRLAKPAPSPIRRAERQPAPARTAPRPAPAIRPHRMHIIVDPPVRPALEPAQAPTLIEPALPQVQVDPAQTQDLGSRLDALTGVAAADMQDAKLALAPELSAGRAGAVTLTLPPQLLADLSAKAQALGLGDAAPSVWITARLSGQGYGVAPVDAMSAPLQPGQPASFTWRATPTGAAAGALSAEMTASLQIDGQPVALPLGVLTLQTSPILVPAPGEPAGTAAPAPDLRTRLLAFLDPGRLPGLSGLHLRDLAIPGRPTVNLPVFGEVASQNLVAAGLVMLLVMLLNALFSGWGDRALRRRSLEALEAGRFRD